MAIIDIEYQHPNIVIAAFVCTIIAVTAATMFLSCFRKKKGDKKKKDGKKDGKKNAPIVPATSPTSNAPVDTKPSITVEDHSKSDEETKAQDKNFQETNEVLADFSAVRETEILRSYRKPPPPQNRARLSRAPRALKSSAENLDVFSEVNNDLFEFNKDSTIKPSTSVRDDEERAPEKGKEENDEVQKREDDEDEEEDDKSKKRGSSQGRSSMLDEINNTLASIQSGTSGDRSIDEKVDEVKEEMTTKVVTTVNAKIEEGVKSIDEEVNDKSDEISETLNSMKEESEDVKNTAAVSSSSAMKNIADGVKGHLSTEVEEKIKEKEKEVEEKEVDEKVEGLKNVSNENSVERDSETKSKFQNGVEAAKEVGEIKIEEITCKLKEHVESAVTDAVPGLNSDNTPKDDVPGDLTNEHKEEVCVVNSVPELETSPQKEKKIPPKVSPKPSPKFKPKNVALPVLETTTVSQEEKEQHAPPPVKDKQLTNHESVPSRDEKTAEKVESPPTTPTSPSTKGASRIPMSKKTSGIPKLSFHPSNKSSSASPLSSPDSAMKRLDQAEETAVQKLQKETDKVAAGVDLKTNHETPSKLDEDTPKPDNDTSKHDGDTSKLDDDTSKLDGDTSKVDGDTTKADLEPTPSSPTKETSPFPDENRGSKRKLTKLRYSGRKKSTESKSDESGGSERSSRAGSEAKSDDGKKAGEDAETDKGSRIPVRGGSKPRSSPPKSLGNQ